MSETNLLLWDFADAPVSFRRLVPLADITVADINGWVAFVCAGSSLEIVEVLIARWRLSGQTVRRFEVEGGGIVLVGAPAGDRNGKM